MRPPAPLPPLPQGHTVLRVDGLGVERRQGAILTRVSFEVCAGEIVVVIGPNGAGKSTLLGALLGVVRRSAGAVVGPWGPLRSLKDWSKVASWMPDNAQLPGEVGVATLLAHAQSLSHTAPAHLEELVARLGLGALRGARAGELSHGEKKRVQLAVALCTHRPLVILDEPLGAFDPLQLQGVLALIQERARAGTAFLITVHQLGDAHRLAHKVLLLARGGVLAWGTVEALRAQTQMPGATLEQVFLRLLEGDAYAAP